jgi:hypothetical protein
MFRTISSRSRPAHRGRPAASCALEQTGAGSGWLRARSSNPGPCCFCAVWVPARWGVAVVMLDIGQQTDVRALHGNHLDAEAAPRSSLQGALRFC